MEDYKNNNEQGFDAIFTEIVKAGKRTYFFDVKETRAKEYYLTLTERKRTWKDDGSYDIEKHKIFLYKEDLDKFLTGVEKAIEYIKKNQPGVLD